MNPADGNNFGLEILKPKFDSQIDRLGFMNMVWILSGQYYVSDRVAIVYDLPISFYAPEEKTTFDKSETSFGNPYFGIRLDSPIGEKNKFTGRVGLRIPIASEEKYSAASIGLYTSFDRLEAFIPELFSTSFSGTFTTKTSENIDFNFSLGGDLMKDTDDGGESEFYINYNFEFIADIDNILLLGGFTGRYLATEDGDFEELSVHQIGFSGYYNGENFKPGILFRLPVDDDLNELVDMVIGIKLIFNMK